MGLDLSYTRTGICVWDGVQALPFSVSTKTGNSYISRARKIRDTIDVLSREHSPDLFCFEAPLSHAHRAEILTGLFFVVLDSVLDFIQPVIALPNPSMRKVMGIKQAKGSKFKKAQIVERAKTLIGPDAPKMVHDEADAFFLAYYARRFWTLEEEDLSQEEQEVWYSEKVVGKKPKKKSAKKIKRKGVIYRQGEFFFLPEKGL